MSDTDTEQLSGEQLADLRAAGVSPEALAVIRIDPETVGRSRNSAREQARKVLRPVLGSPDPEDVTPSEYGGDYFAGLCNGSVGKAFIHADIANLRLLLEAFGRAYLIERLVADEGYRPGAARKKVDDVIERYGDDILH